MFYISIGYPCAYQMEKCCNVEGNFFCAPNSQSCFGYKKEPFEPCSTSEKRDDTHLGRFAGKTGNYFPLFLRKDRNISNFRKSRDGHNSTDFAINR